MTYLVWNGIVKNESKILERCVRSLMPHIGGAVIVDTGSSDGTPELLQQLFDEAKKPLELHSAPFENFSQARNVALQAARNSSLPWEWALLVDADMELVVDDPNWSNKVNGGLAYDVKQTGGSLVYWNRRLLSRAAGGYYACPVHEYLDVPTAGTLSGIWFRDHADGGNRPGKLERDIGLLEAALKTETRPGLIERIHFYLAQSLYDLGRFDDAITHYRRRVELGGFEEERWFAQYRIACCFGQLGDGPNAVWAGLRAYSMRPARAEVLYELAQFFRVRGDNPASLLFSEVGLRVPYPKNDLLFVNEWIYKSGLREEFAISGYYSDRHRAAAAKECNKLALAGSVQAQSNLFWYLKPLSDDVSSFKPQQIAFEAPPGYVPCNPSVTAHGERPLFLVRTVNYTINAEGGYDIRDGDGACSNRNPIHTRNFLVRSHNFVVPAELTLPENSPFTAYGLVRGFEDSRLFGWDDRLWTLSTVREWNEAGWCEQVLAPVTSARGYGEDWKVVSKQGQHEKNWMPWVKDGELRFVYRLGHLVDAEGADICRYDCGFNVERISGGSQVVQVDERTWLALVHEAGFLPGRFNRFYQHRFVVFRPNGAVDRISPPFFFHDRQIEFCAGLAVFGKQLMVSYGVRDCEAWTATIDTEEVLRFVYKDAL